MIRPERRTYVREEARFFTTLRQSPGTEETVLPQVGFSHNISAGGMFFHTQSKVEIGGEIFLTIYPAGNWSGGGIPLKLKVRGKVLRVNPSNASYPSGDLYGVAVQFLHEPTLFIGEKEVDSCTFA